MDHSIASMSERERKCIKFLAKRLEEEGEWYSTTALALSIDALPGEKIEPNHVNALIAMMIEYGVLVDKGGGGWDGSREFVITTVAIRLDREIDRYDKEQNEPRDIVEKVNQSVRKQWILALLIIGFFVLTAAVTFANQLVQLFQNVGWMERPN